MTDYKTNPVHMGPAMTNVDLTDGSERADYVDQDYVLRQLGRPHRCINLMYCYYPDDKGWPARVSEVYKSDGSSGAWGYPYDDYFTYKGGVGGDLSDEPFKYMRDIRRHGQDVCLTLTMDPFLDDERIAAVARDLRTFGRMQVRVNHEATGSWFSFNKRASYEQVAAFFCKVCDIFHREAPNCKMILCLDGCTELDKDAPMVMEDIFTDAAKHTDIVSVDRYFTLHYGFPTDICDEETKTYYRLDIDTVYQLYKNSYNRYIKMNDGNVKPMVLSELNSDGDVTGPYEQAEMVKDFCDRVKADPEKWLEGFTMYMFRDSGRLGLEITDPNNKNVGVKQPLMDTYREIIHDEYFSPKFTSGNEVALPAKLRWGSFTDSDGLEIPMVLKKKPVFYELYFGEELKDANLMIETGGEWFYKAPGTRFVDLAPAFFGKEIGENTSMPLRFFAPPASGENDSSQGEDWQENYYYTLKALPEIRIKYNPIQ
ncbi:MAG: hypothetical protein K5848_02200 [Lachnospiraceae bacterium]|nr:hypothetical protein [Lachnospiraceae bacterium]